MRILSRLRNLVVLSLGSLVVLAFFLGWSLNEAEQTKADEAVIEALRAALVERASLRDQFFLYREARARAQWIEKTAETQQLIDQARHQIEGAEQLALLQRLAVSFNDTQNIFARILVNADRLKGGAAGPTIEEFDKRLMSQLLVKAAEVHDLAIALQALSKRKERQAMQRLSVATVIFALVLSGFTTWVLVFVSQLIRQRLALLHAGTGALARGELDYRLPAEGADELADVARAVNLMTEKQQANMQQLERELAVRAQVEETLRQREALFRGIFDHAALGVVLVEPGTGQFLRVNQGFCRITGYTAAELERMTVQALTHPDDRPIGEESMRQLRDRAIEHYSVEKRYLHRSGRTVWGNVAVSAVFDAKGKCEYFIGVFEDVSARKASEIRLQLAASVFNHAREGITITDVAGDIVEVNDAFVAITGYRRDEVLGKNPRILSSGRQSPDYYQTMWQALEADGHWCGEIWNRRKNGEVYAEFLSISAVHDGSGALQHYVGLFTDITQMKEHQQQLEHIAHYDALTGLPNRVLLTYRLQQDIAQCQRRQQSLAVAYLDLDGFKAVNDQYGHEVGDELLITFAKRLRTALRECDTLARIGGDEFVAVLAGLGQPQDCEPVLVRLLQCAAEPVRVGDKSLYVSASIGVTLYPQDGGDTDLLLRHADQAMYLAKQAGKNRYHLFDVDQDAAVRSQRESVEQIRFAFERREFVLFYQPKVNMKSGRVIGAEALIRWQHPIKGLLPPGTFLPLIENHALCIELGEWVIATALDQLSAWNAAGLELQVSVNVAARQLQLHSFVARLAELLAAHPSVRPEQLELEILETSALDDVTQVSELMHACRKLGVGFAIDDFGTGYSSLTYLKRLPAELLKIDQSFVRDMLHDPDDLAIVEGVVGLARSFRRQVIAEGVETRAHGDALLALGCELAQGYGIARPMPAAELPAWVALWLADRRWTA